MLDSTEDQYPFYRHQIHDQAFLERARDHLRRFDEGDLPCLFYAALELRLGIEARLHSYINAAYRKRKRPNNLDSMHIATKLLAKLKEINPDAEQKMFVGFKFAKSDKGSAFEFTPVTKKLARMHGKLGELLHFNFYIKNTDWLVKPPLHAEGRTLADVRRWLDAVVIELSEACRGALLSHPEFENVVIRLEEELD